VQVLAPARKVLSREDAKEVLDLMRHALDAGHVAGAVVMTTGATEQERQDAREHAEKTWVEVCRWVYKRTEQSA
jgi:hypothetical protein